MSRLPLHIGSNDAAGDGVTEWQRWGKQYAPAYAALMGPVDGYYGVSDATFTREMQRRLGIVQDGVFSAATAAKVGYRGTPATPMPGKPFLYTFAGTWSYWDAGFQADTARALDDTYRWQPCAYPASFGPINPPYPGAPSYVQSVEQGVAEGIRLINLNPGKFALSGYSQGAEAVGRLCQVLTTGRLTHRLRDCLAVVTFGDPARQASDRTLGDGQGTGISKLIIEPGIDRVTAAVRGDMYATIPEGQAGDQMHAVYVALTHLGTGKIDGHGPLLAALIKIATDPLTGGMAVIDAVIRAAQVSAHGNYAQHIPAAVDHLRSAARR